MQIGVSGFQSLERVKLEFDGFTVVTGESNLGKSALIRAVQSPVFGMAGDFFIREGFKLCAVGVRFDPQLALKWQKVPADKKAPGRETLLDINGVQHTKMGRDQFSLTEPLGFLSVSTAAGELRPQFAGQFDKAFLLDVSDTVVAEVFKVLGRGDVVASARDSARRDLSKKKSELVVRDGDIESASTLVKRKVWVRPFVKEVTGLQAEIPKIESTQTLLNKVEGWCAEQLPDALPEVPVAPDLSKLLSVLGRLENYREMAVPSTPLFDPLNEVLFNLIGKLECVITEGTLLDAHGLALDDAQAEAGASLKQLEVSLGVCPLCGGGFDHAHD